jgi:hypothetical protein
MPAESARKSTDASASPSRFPHVSVPVAPGFSEPHNAARPWGPYPPVSSRLALLKEHCNHLAGRTGARGDISPTHASTMLGRRREDSSSLRAYRCEIELPQDAIAHGVRVSEQHSQVPMSTD